VLCPFLFNSQLQCRKVPFVSIPNRRQGVSLGHSARVFQTSLFPIELLQLSCFAPPLASSMDHQRQQEIEERRRLIREGKRPVSPDDHLAQRRRLPSGERVHLEPQRPRSPRSGPAALEIEEALNQSVGTHAAEELGPSATASDEGMNADSVVVEVFPCFSNSIALVHAVAC
jgi:hypothetical protein